LRDLHNLRNRFTLPTVIPAKAGIQPFASHTRESWIPAFAGMTSFWGAMTNPSLQCATRESASCIGSRQGAATTGINARSSMITRGADG
jgi:hypothetical protein